MPLTVPVTLEGNYSTWTEIAGSPLTFSSTAQIAQAFIDETGNFGAIIDKANDYMALITIDPPSVISETLDHAILSTDMVPMYGSLLGKYIVHYLSSDSPSKLYIYKSGVLTETLSLAYTTDGVWISPRGKYVFALDFSTKQLHVYKGS